VTEQDLQGKHGQFITPRQFAALVAEHDRVVSF